MTPEYKAWVDNLFDLWKAGMHDEVRERIANSPTRVVFGLRDGVLMHDQLEAMAKGGERRDS